HVRRQLAHPGVEHRLEFGAVAAGVGEDLEDLDLAVGAAPGPAALDHDVVGALDRTLGVLRRGGRADGRRQRQAQQGEQDPAGADHGVPAIAGASSARWCRPCRKLPSHWISSSVSDLATVAMIWKFALSTMSVSPVRYSCRRWIT